MRCQHYQHVSWCSSQCARQKVETFLRLGIADGTVQEFCPTSAISRIPGPCVRWRFLLKQGVADGSRSITCSLLIRRVRSVCFC